MRFTRGALALGALAALMLSGCSSTGSLPQDEVEKTVAEKLAKQQNQPVPKIDCPGDLKGEVDTTMRCMLTAGGSQIGVTLTVTEVDGDNIKYDIKVDDKVAG